jgi:voltage-gated potassium channel
MRLSSARRHAHLLLHNPTGKNPVTAWLNRLIATLIIANAVAVALETVPSLYQGNERLFMAFEAISTLVFLAEYIIRIWCSVEQAKYAHPFFGRLRWATSPVALLDLIVVATYFAPVDLRFLRLARLLRLLRVLHLDGMASTYDHLKVSIAARKQLLLVSAVLMFIALFSSAALLYICEHEAQPKVFTSIPATLWWSVITLTTIGYGDIFPITAAGKICAAFTAIFGVGIFALPAAILTGAVIEAGGHTQTCPHCGKEANSRE